MTAAAITARRLPIEIAFLAAYGVAGERLAEVARRADALRVTADRVLLGEGYVGEAFYYRCLAHHLGVAFVDGPVQPDVEHLRPQASLAGYVPLAADRGPRWLGAPRGAALSGLLARVQAGENLRGSLVVTTPARLADIVHRALAQTIADDASLGLWRLDPALSARHGLDPQQRIAAALFGTALLAAFFTRPWMVLAVVGAVVTAYFFAAILLRLAVCAASADRPIAPAPLDDGDLPVYSIVVALYDEERMAPLLIRRLARLDYPAAKLDIKFVTEACDRRTLAALRREPLPASIDIVVAPPGLPRTKPRALNVALPLLRGNLVVVFDAEDEPEPNQLRDAAAHFRSRPGQVACLQGRLALYNGAANWLTRLFAIEYAALYDVFVVGLAALRLPTPLGGSTNHFRIDALRAVGGWDAWNVTEDADLGLRLARFGYHVEALAATTYEEAPLHLASWFGQRRRWCKGWLQTLVVLCRRPGRLLRDLGFWRTLAAFLLFGDLLLAPLLWPPATLGLILDMAWYGLPTTENPWRLLFVTLWLSVSVAGAGSFLWRAALGMARRGLGRTWPWLLLSPIYYALISAAAWVSLIDAVRAPQYWHKTPHGVGTRVDGEDAVSSKPPKG